MAFSTRRGRPRHDATKRDFGTPELRQKHMLGLTREAMDLCLERGWIDESEHRAGLHFRWLYTLKYGAPGPYAKAFAEEYLATPRVDDPSWRAERESDYEQAAELLNREHFFLTVQAICIYGEIPQHSQARTALKGGLALLADLWQMDPKRENR